MINISKRELEDWLLSIMRQERFSSLQYDHIPIRSGDMDDQGSRDSESDRVIVFSIHGLSAGKAIRKWGDLLPSAWGRDFAPNAEMYTI